MKGKLVLTLGFAGVLAVSIGFAKDLQLTEASAEVSSKQTDTYKLWIVNTKSNNFFKG